MEEEEELRKTHQRLGELRNDLYTGALQGLIAGVGIGLIGPFIIKLVSSRYRSQINKNVYVFSALTCGAIGSYVGNTRAYRTSLVYIKGTVHPLPLPEQAIQSLPPKSSYQTILDQNKRSELEERDAAFQRRAEAIKKSKEQGTINKETENNWK